MANTKSAIKTIRRIQRQTLVNKSEKVNIETLLKRLTF